MFTRTTPSGLLLHRGTACTESRSLRSASQAHRVQCACQADLLPTFVFLPQLSSLQHPSVPLQTRVLLKRVLSACCAYVLGSMNGSGEDHRQRRTVEGARTTRPPQRSTLLCERGAHRLGGDVDVPPARAVQPALSIDRLQGQTSRNSNSGLPTAVTKTGGNDVTERPSFSPCLPQETLSRHTTAFSPELSPRDISTVAMLLARCRFVPAELYEAFAEYLGELARAPQSHRRPLTGTDFCCFLQALVDVRDTEDLSRLESREQEEAKGEREERKREPIRGTQIADEFKADAGPAVAAPVPQQAAEREVGLSNGREANRRAIVSDARGVEVEACTTQSRPSRQRTAVRVSVHLLDGLLPKVIRSFDQRALSTFSVWLGNNFQKLQVTDNAAGCPPSLPHSRPTGSLPFFSAVSPAAASSSSTSRGVVYTTEDGSFSRPSELPSRRSFEASSSARESSEEQQPVPVLSLQAMRGQLERAAQVFLAEVASRCLSSPAAFSLDARSKSNCSLVTPFISPCSFPSSADLPWIQGRNRESWTPPSTSSPPSVGTFLPSLAVRPDPTPGIHAPSSDLSSASPEPTPKAARASRSPPSSLFSDVKSYTALLCCLAKLPRELLMSTAAPGIAEGVFERSPAEEGKGHRKERKNESLTCDTLHACDFPVWAEMLHALLPPREVFRILSSASDVELADFLWACRYLPLLPPSHFLHHSAFFQTSAPGGYRIQESALFLSSEPPASRSRESFSPHAPSPPPTHPPRTTSPGDPARGSDFFGLPRLRHKILQVAVEIVAGPSMPSSRSVSSPAPCSSFPSAFPSSRLPRPSTASSVRVSALPTCQLPHLSPRLEHMRQAPEILARVFYYLAVLVRRWFSAAACSHQFA